MISFSMLKKFSTIISSKIFSYPFSFSSSSGTPIIQKLLHLILSQWSLRISSFFAFFCSSEVIPTILSSSSLIRSSASDILLLIPSSDFTFTFHFRALEKEMATHSSVLAWRIPEMGEPGGLLSMGSHRVRHN